MRPIREEELASGPKLAGLRDAPIVGTVCGLPVHVVSSSMSQPRRRAIARIAYVAQRAVPTFKTSYDGTVTEDDQRLYIVRRHERAIAFVRPEVSHLGPVYDKLCDYVHHNGPSHFTASSGFFVGRAGMHHESGGAIVTNKPGTVTRYEYPNPQKLAKALHDTSSTVALAAKICKVTLDQIPRTPFAADTIKKMTGTDSGVVFLGWSEKSRPH